MEKARSIIAGALGGVLLLAHAAGADARPRPSDVPGAQSAIVPNGFQLYNDYAAPEHTYSSARVVVHYVTAGLDAPPLNDDDADGVPDYVERVGDAADRALATFERRGFRAPRPDEAGPDARPDLYVSRFAPGMLGVAFPAAETADGAFAVVSNNLDPSDGQSFASVYATVAHELFHLVQFAYFPPDADPPIPAWILEGTAAAIETAPNPELDDLVTGLQTRGWLAATGQSLTGQTYAAQLLWRRLDAEQPRLLPALFTQLAERPPGGVGERDVAATYAHVAGRPFADAFRRFAVSLAADHAEALVPVFELRRGGRRRASVAGLAVHVVRLALPRRGAYSLSVVFPRGRGAGAATVSYELESATPGGPPRFRTVASRRSSGGRRLTFAVPRDVRASPRLAHPFLVISNGGGRSLPYVVDAR